MINIYTDGSCSKNPGPGGWAFYVVFCNDEGIFLNDLPNTAEFTGNNSNTTNNIMEITAIISAFEYIKNQKLWEKSKKITIYSDSNYAVKGFNEWSYAWQKNGRLNDQHKDPVKNIPLWLDLLKLKSFFNNLAKNNLLIWELKWIKAHEEIKNTDDIITKQHKKGNHIADARANQAVKF